MAATIGGHGVTDLEMTKLCAEAMGLEGYTPTVNDECLEKDNYHGGSYEVYDPLHDDEQAMSLVKRLGLTIYCERQDARFYWEVDADPPLTQCPHGPDLNRAIVQCVAKMQASKK